MIPFIPLELDKVYNLRFGMGAAYEFEKLTGVKVTQIDLATFSIIEIAQLLWVMMRQENKDLTLEQTLKLIDDYADNLLDVTEKIGEAITLAFTRKDKPKNG